MPQYSSPQANHAGQRESIQRLRNALEQTRALYDTAKDQAKCARYSYPSIRLRDVLFTKYRLALSEFTSSSTAKPSQIGNASLEREERWAAKWQHNR
jgi:hypothetical protein